MSPLFANANGEKIQIGEQLDWRALFERTGGNRSDRASRAAIPNGSRTQRCLSRPSGDLRIFREPASGNPQTLEARQDECHPLARIFHALSIWTAHCWAAGDAALCRRAPAERGDYIHRSTTCEICRLDGKRISESKSISRSWQRRARVRLPNHWRPHSIRPHGLRLRSMWYLSAHGPVPQSARRVSMRPRPDA